MGRRAFLATLVALAVVLGLGASASADPTLNLPPDQTLEATGPGGAVFTFSATDQDGNPANCSPDSGSTFPLGETTVECESQDGTASGSFHVTVQDTTAPTISGADDVTAEATGPSGAAVSFNPTASDLVDGSITPNCDHTSGDTYPLGSTTVTCTATDSHSNQAQASFTVKVEDTTPPILSGVPSPGPIEATGPAGSQVFFTAPTASDTVDPGPLGVACAPPSGSTFALGSTTVICTSSDASGNQGAASFAVHVVDTTPPTLSLPSDLVVEATEDAGIPASSSAVVKWLAKAKATDVADPAPVVTNNAPVELPVGTTVVTFTARDASGNTTTKKRNVTVTALPGSPPPPPPPPGGGGPPPPPPPPTPSPRPTPDTTPPGNVRNLKARALSRAVLLTWGLPRDADLDHVTITRAKAGAGSASVAVYSGKGTRFRDKGLTNYVQYRYLVVTYDRAQNHGAGVSATAYPQAAYLVSPADGARVKVPVRLVWRRFSNASFYNVQLYRGTRKLLSAWPTKPALSLARRWKYKGATQTLTSGVYRWYVWPAFGSRARPNYGGLLGQRSFVVG